MPFAARHSIVAILKDSETEVGSWLALNHVRRPGYDMSRLLFRRVECVVEMFLARFAMLERVSCGVVTRGVRSLYTLPPCFLLPSRLANNGAYD